MASLLKDSGGLSNMSYLQEAVTQQTESSLNNSWGPCVLMGQTLLGSFYHISFKTLCDEDFESEFLNCSTYMIVSIQPPLLLMIRNLGCWETGRKRSLS